MQDGTTLTPSITFLSQTVIVKTDDPQEARTYPLRVTASLRDYSAVTPVDVDFNLVIGACLVLDLIKPATFIGTQVYKVKEDAMPVTNLLYSFSPQCVQASIAYVSTLENGTPLPTWITFDATKLSYVIKTDASANKGIYYIKVQASVVNLGQDTTSLVDEFVWTLLVESDEAAFYEITPNTAPFFDIPPTNDVTVKAGEALRYELSTIRDLEGDDVKVTVDMGKAAEFMFFWDFKNEFQILADRTNNTDAGYYQIKITLTDNHTSEALATEYDFRLIVEPSFGGED